MSPPKSLYFLNTNRPKKNFSENFEEKTASTAARVGRGADYAIACEGPKAENGGLKKGSFSFPPPPTALKLEFYGLTCGFTRLIMKSNIVYHGLNSLHVNFHDNRTK